LSDLLAKIVFSAVWPARASFLERDFHRSHGSAVKVFNDHCRTSAKEQLDRRAALISIYKELVRAF